MDQVWLELAKEAYGNNDRARARELLAGYVRMHADDPEGWYWLARCVENRSARILYYQKTLALQPSHFAACTELTALLPVPQGIGPDHHSALRSAPTLSPEQFSESVPIQLTTNWRFSLRRLAGTTFFGLSLLFAAMVSLRGVIPLLVGFRPFVIMSGSMEPTIATGSVAIARPVSAPSLEVGDIIAFNPHPDSVMPTIHRIVQIEERQGTRYYTTRGDANTGDDTEMALPQMGMRVIGAIPWAGYAVYYAAQPAGTLLLVVIPFFLLVLFWIKDRVVQVRQAQTV